MRIFVGNPADFCGHSAGLSLTIQTFTSFLRSASSARNFVRGQELVTKSYVVRSTGKGVTCDE